MLATYNGGMTHRPPPSLAGARYSGASRLLAPVLGFHKRGVPLDGDAALLYERAVFADEQGWHVALREDREAEHGPALQRAMESVVDACLLELQGLYRLKEPIFFYHLQYQASRFAAAPGHAPVAWGAQRVERLMREGQCVFARWVPLSSAAQNELIEALCLQSRPPSKYR